MSTIEAVIPGSKLVKGHASNLHIIILGTILILF